MFERSFASIYEISSKNQIAGRRPIKVVLHEIFPNDSMWQENGITWKEEYVQANLHSVAGMSIVAAFLTEDRDAPYDHGLTEIREEDSLPLFEDATMVGHFEKAYVDDVEIGGVMKRCLVAEGTLDEMRYPKFVAWLREHMADSVVKGSVEIVGKAEHDNFIVYSNGWKEKGRIPQYYDYSGYAILGVKPADESAIVMELNNKKLEEEDEVMDEKTKSELMAAISGAVSEVSSKWEEYYAKVEMLEAEIAQLRADIKQKEADIAQLSADYEKAIAEKSAIDAGIAEANAAKEAAESNLAEANAKIAEMENAAALAELNAVLAPYSEEQKACAKEDIDSFIANPGSIEINSIVGKICTAIVKDARESYSVETNSDSHIDVFGMMDDASMSGSPDEGEVDVF